MKDDYRDKPRGDEGRLIRMADELRIIMSSIGFPPDRIEHVIARTMAAALHLRSRPLMLERRAVPPVPAEGDVTIEDWMYG